MEELGLCTTTRKAQITGFESSVAERIFAFVLLMQALILPGNGRLSMKRHHTIFQFGM